MKKLLLVLLLVFLYCDAPMPTNDMPWLRAGSDTRDFTAIAIKNYSCVFCGAKASLVWIEGDDYVCSMCSGKFEIKAVGDVRVIVPQQRGEG